MAKVIGVIPARYGSTRFPGKPLARIGNRSMIEWTYVHACSSTLLSEVIIATDDDRIVQECKEFGAKVVMTSSEHVSGTDRLQEVVSKIPERDLIVVNIQGDEPDVDPELIDGVVELKLKNRSWEMTTGAYELTDPTDWNDPNKVKLTFARNGKAMYFSRSLIPSQWKKEAKVYRHLGIYCYERDALMSFHELPPSELEAAESLEQLRAMEAGFTIGVYVTSKLSLSVDVPDDLEKVIQEFQKRGLLG